MTVNILTGFEKVNTIINRCITDEINPNGILYDVEDFINTYFTEGEVEEQIVKMTIESHWGQ